MLKKLNLHLASLSSSSNSKFSQGFLKRIVSVSSLRVKFIINPSGVS
ncbi:hypothetical protein C1336_000230000 [Campylobacter jejuni subsp. jejuni 1336]|nr:hypothetical protein C1336_000230000 [Campylobacter jejuni subsp. jejuni 1336]